MWNVYIFTLSVFKKEAVLIQDTYGRKRIHLSLFQKVRRREGCGIIPIQHSPPPASEGLEGVVLITCQDTAHSTIPGMLQKITRMLIIFFLIGRRWGGGVKIKIRWAQKFMTPQSNLKSPRSQKAQTGP